MLFHISTLFWDTRRPQTTSGVLAINSTCYSRHCSFFNQFLTSPFSAIPDTQENIFLFKYHNFYAGTNTTSQLAKLAKIQHICDPGKSSKIYILNLKRTLTTTLRLLRTAYWLVHNTHTYYETMHNNFYNYEFQPSSKLHPSANSLKNGIHSYMQNLYHSPLLTERLHNVMADNSCY